MDTIEIQKTETDWQAKIWDNGKADYGFIPLPYTLGVSFSRIKAELEEINPEHTIVYV